MNFIIFLQLIFTKILLFPKFAICIIKDKIKYYKNKEWQLFEYWGMHIYIGMFGKGKTSTMVRDAYLLAKKYKQLTILTNVKLTNFPVHTNIIYLKSAQDILKAPENTLVLIDEIGTIFNSRDFSKSKESVPKILFQHLCQCRHRRMMIFSTAQRWNFLDKQLRDITATVRTTRVTFEHPFSRMVTVKKYDAADYDMHFSNPLFPLNPISAWCYVQSDKIRNLYDTTELVEQMLSAEYIPDNEILENQGYTTMFDEINKDNKKVMRKNKKV